MKSNTPLSVYSWTEISSHNSPTDGWVVINGFVYDISHFLEIHPGGHQILEPLLGTDATEAFSGKGSYIHSRNAVHLLKNYRIGVSEGTSAKAIQIEISTDIEKKDFGIDWKRGLLAQIPTNRVEYDQFLNETFFVQQNLSLKYFDNPILESLTKSPWWAVLAFWIPMIGLFMWSSSSLGTDRLTLIALMLCGYWLWQLTEWTLHRFVFHHVVDSKIGIWIHFTLHGYHHLFPLDPWRLVFPPAGAGIIGALILLGLTTIFSIAISLGILSGVAIGYVQYDMIHYWTHHARNPISFFKDLKRHHMYHHYHDDNKNFGISTKLFDVLFGTLKERKSK